MPNDRVKSDKSDLKFCETAFVMDKYVKTKKYLDLNDFDDHFSDITLDFRNQSI